ncbi:hypothetical protein N9L66_03350 [Porticoccaceae bacterium]|nr:hypothetical protein [Porticoccaceae bacterium]MDB2343108.1 hypothetical protein [Porticoccaceae bacterium]
MGSISTVIDKDFQYSDEKALIRDSLTWTSDDFIASIEQLSKVGSAWYAAIEFTPREDVGLFEDHHYYVSDSKDGSITWAAIIGVHRSTYGGVCYFGRKSMEESMGPVSSWSRAPISLIEKLSPLKPDADGDSVIWIERWRSRCCEHHERRAKVGSLKDGAVIKLANALSFPNVGELTVFKKVSLGKNSWLGYRNLDDLDRGFSVARCILRQADILRAGFFEVIPD